METRYAERVVAHIRELCAKLDISAEDCEKAVEYYRKNRKLFQGSKPKNAAATALHVAAGVPLGRLGRPADIAEAMVFLASAGAAYITGQTIVVDGGATLPEVRPAG